MFYRYNPLTETVDNHSFHGGMYPSRVKRLPVNGVKTKHYMDVKGAWYSVDELYLTENQALKAGTRNLPTGTERAVVEDITARQKAGIKKYGTTVEDNKLTRREWVQHAYEEALDLAIYLKKLGQEIDKLAAGQSPDQIFKNLSSTEIARALMESLLQGGTEVTGINEFRFGSFRYAIEGTEVRMSDDEPTYKPFKVTQPGDKFRKYIPVENLDGSIPEDDSEPDYGDGEMNGDDPNRKPVPPTLAPVSNNPQVQVGDLQKFKLACCPTPINKTVKSEKDSTFDWKAVMDAYKTARAIAANPPYTIGYGPRPDRGDYVKRTRDNRWIAVRDRDQARIVCEHLMTVDDEANYVWQDPIEYKTDAE